MVDSLTNWGDEDAVNEGLGPIAHPGAEAHNAHVDDDGLQVNPDQQDEPLLPVLPFPGQPGPGPLPLPPNPVAPPAPPAPLAGAPIPAHQLQPLLLPQAVHHLQALHLEALHLAHHLQALHDQLALDHHLPQLQQQQPLPQAQALFFDQAFPQLQQQQQPLPQTQALFLHQTLPQLQQQQPLPQAHQVVQAAAPHQAGAANPAQARAAAPSPPLDLRQQAAAAEQVPTAKRKGASAIERTPSAQPPAGVLAAATPRLEPRGCECRKNGCRNNNCWCRRSGRHCGWACNCLNCVNR
eukprot:jgi/Botrbrau1/1150/Bobra.0162s0041.1